MLLSMLVQVPVCISICIVCDGRSVSVVADETGEGPAAWTHTGSNSSVLLRPRQSGSCTELVDSVDVAWHRLSDFLADVY
jgi:hypothetical protein